MKNLFTSVIFSLSVILNSYAQNPQLWALTQQGGSSNGGAIIKINGDGSGFARPYSFATPYPGANPFSNMIQASNGLLYGVTRNEGADNKGTIFSYNPTSASYTDLFDFNDTLGAYPEGSLVQDSNGLLYGVTALGGTKAGVMFSYNPATAAFTLLYNFDTIGYGTLGSLLLAGNGLLYGMTNLGGVGNKGVVFSYIPGTATCTKLFDFNSVNGYYPCRNLMQASNGLLYGMTEYGGANNAGIIFSYNINTASYSGLFDFIDSTGANPYVNSLVQDSNGLLYGVTNAGGTHSLGVIFSYNPGDSTYTDLFNFSDSSGAYPEGSLVAAGNGLLYGMTWSGGADNYGVIFSYNISDSTYTNLFDFNATDGGNNYGGLMRASNGILYGVTTYTGSYGPGIMFSYNPGSSTYTRLLDFNQYPDGYSPEGSLVLAGNGLLYGTAATGGADNYGVIFSYSPALNAYMKIFDFNDTVGAYPLDDLIRADNGLLYGTADNGGVYNDGVIFSFNINTAAYTDLFDFNNTVGFAPNGLLRDSNGLFYGTTTYGGADSAGVIFSYNPNTSAYTKLFDFTDTIGAQPFGGSLVQDSNGILYGMTGEGGVYGYGVIFSYNPGSSTYTKLFDFNDTYGTSPYSSLVQAGNGILYGMTNAGGAHGYGVIFGYNLNDSTYTNLFDFNGTTGAYPLGSLLQASNGLLYGTTNEGGAYSDGVIFSYNINTATYTDIEDLNAASGDYPMGNLIELTNYLAIKPIDAVYDIKLYPNPTSDELIVESDLFANNEIVFKLYDVSGKLQSVDYVQLASQIKINTGNLAAGMYWLQININGQEVSRNFVKD